MVILAFWSTKMEADYPTILHLSRIKKRFQDSPLAILAVHDASLTSLAEFKKALAPLRDQIAGDIPVRLLLDRPPIGEGRSLRAAPARMTLGGRRISMTAWAGTCLLSKNSATWP